MANDVSMATREKLQRMVYREFLAQRDLAAEAGLERLPERLAGMLGGTPQQGLDALLESFFLEPLTLPQLQELLAIRDMTLVSRTAAAVAAELKEPDVSYERAIRTALCYAVAGLDAHVFGALRAAAAKRDDWAHHHLIYGLMHGIAGNRERAVWELSMALQHEPYEDMRIRIRAAIDLLELEGSGAAR